MHANSDIPLDLPANTLAVIDKARHAAHRTRRTVEVSIGSSLAGAALSAVGLGSFMLVGHESLPDWAKWSVAGPALLIACGGTLLVYSDLWTWLRRGRRGGQQSPFGDACAALSTRRRFGLIAMAFSIALVEGIGFQILRGRIPDDVYYGIMIWGTRLTVLALIAFYVRRFVRSGFWEHMVFAAGIAGTGGLYIFVPIRQQAVISPVPVCIAVLSMLATLAAATSLIGRWRRWARANKAADSIDQPASTEVA